MGPLILPILLPAFEHLTSSPLFQAFGFSSAKDGFSGMFASSPKDQVYKIYEKVNPEKLGELDQIMLKYEGKEDELIKRLEKKYGIRAENL